jgi:hypothetical protein
MIRRTERATDFRTRTLRAWCIPLAILASAFALRPSLAHAASKPTILKRTLAITPWRFTSYWRNPNGSEPEWDTWSWVPRINFDVLGPVDAGSQFSVEYTMPDGKPWLEYDLQTEEIGEGQVSSLENPGSGAGRDKLEKQATLATGVFGFKIRVKNELMGTDDVLMSGKFKVTKYHKGLAQYKNQFEYSIDEDWRMPMGWLWLDPHTSENTPYLMVGVWLRGKWSSGDLAAYVMHNGQKVASTKEQYGGQESRVTLTTIDGNEDDPTWNLWEFEWRGVFGYNNGDPIDNPLVYFLDKNPGDYQIKVLYSGKLVRTVNFTVGADGRIVDNGIAAQNNILGPRMLVPVTISGDFDGKYDKNAWKTDAFYGNPLIGFSAP